MEDVKKFYMQRDRESFLYRNKMAIVFYTGITAIIGLGLIPWLVGWYHIIF